MGISRQFVSVAPEQKPKQAKVAEPEQPVAKPKSNRGRKKSPTSEATTKPWEAEGVSRNTWYIRKRERRMFEEGLKAGKVNG
jgi:hypothetical protein